MVSLTKNEKAYLIHLLEQHLKKIKEFEKIPDDYFATFAEEIKMDEFLTTLITKLKKE